jgi:hypothetical protein
MNNLEEGIPFNVFLDHFLKEVIKIDAQAQLLQQTGWIEFQKSLKKIDKIDITEGVGQLEYLGLREIKISFFVEPIQPGFWQRLKRFIRYLLGKPSAPAKQACRLVSGSIVPVSAFQVSLTIFRSEDGNFSVKYEPETEQLGGIYVANIIT